MPERSACRQSSRLLHRQRKAGRVRSLSDGAPSRRAARGTAAHRHKGGLRRRRMRRLRHRNEWRTGEQLSGSRASGGRRENSHHRRDRPARFCSARNAAIVSGSWRRAVRHLHARHDSCCGKSSRTLSAPHAKCKSAKASPEIFAAAPATSKFSNRCWRRAAKQVRRGEIVHSRF